VGLKGKNILITAGPTWVPIDRVRIISNIASGKTGIILAKKANGLGAKVTLVLGPAGGVSLGEPIKVKRFSYFDELHDIVKDELKTKRYDIVIHSAAVSDYKLKKQFPSKIKSSSRNLILELESTVKIAERLKKFSPNIFLVIFKLELNLDKNRMIERARKTMKASDADFVVVNTFSNRKSYKAFVIDRENIFPSFDSKEELADNLLKLISARFN
jgi:phosphopantothenoylcysteine decarboxylase/phosphopantothenate--cysteine ligase